MDANIQLRMNEFAAAFAERIKKECNVKNRGEYQAWLAKSMTSSDWDFMAMVEQTIGADATNKWMAKILVDSGKFKTTDGELVEPV